VAQAGHLLSAVLVGYGGPTTLPTSWGELLIGAPHEALTVTGTAFHAIPVPNECSLIGLELATQGLTYVSTPPFNFPPRLTNALDIRIGAY
jgi:hypothetical protein